jgi:heme O synthase-like polyprenyltransferase
MRRLPLLLLLGAVLVALAFVFNPSAEKHRTAIKEATAERSPVAGAFGLGALTAYASTYHTVGVFSYTTANDRALSVGALGIVYVRQ